MTKLDKDDVSSIMLLAHLAKEAGISQVKIDTDHALTLTTLAYAYLNLLENSENEQLH